MHDIRCSRIRAGTAVPFTIPKTTSQAASNPETDPQKDQELESADRGRAGTIGRTVTIIKLGKEYDFSALHRNIRNSSPKARTVTFCQNPADKAWFVHV
jgi:hypothetical protein